MVGRSFMALQIAPDSIAMAPVEFGEWLPDLPERDNPGAVEALNVIASEGGYVPFRKHAPISGLTLPAAARGGALLFDPSGSPQLYGATTEGVYVRQSSAFSLRYTSPTTLYDEFLWQFIQFGRNVVALHPQLLPQAGEVGGSSPFTPLGGNPPIASCGARVGDFLVLGDLDNEVDPDGARQPSRIRWSAFNNIDAPWITDPATQADFNDMPSEGGRVIAITGRESGTIFQERSISRMSYVGLPTVFDIETVEEERGAICGGGVVDIGAFIFFIADDGFFVWNGTNSTPIADNKVNRYFFRRLNYNARRRVVGAVDYVNSCIVWAFPTSGTALDELIIFSYKENRWSHAFKTVEYLIGSAKLDVSLDDLLLNLDVDYPISFDDSSYRGGKPTLGAFDSSHQYGLFNGLNMAATLDSAEFSGPDGRRVFINNARPIIDVGTPVVTVQLGLRDQLMGENIVFQTAVVQETNGECPVLGDGRYVRFRVNVPADTTWSHARGVEPWRKATGRF